MSAVSPISPIAAVSADCYHCGLPCPDRSISADQHAFCCPGCCSVYEILQESGLQQYYLLDSHPGSPPRRPAAPPGVERFAYLDDPQLQAQLLDFNDGHTARATLRLPQIHCVSCVWLLENLQRLQPAVRGSEVDFLRRELALVWDARALSLRQLVEALAGIGYEPEITLGSAPAVRTAGDPLIRRIGVAGFCFGNAMLFSLPEYFASPGDLSDAWRGLFTLLNLALALPVMFYSATDFLVGAWRALVRRTITIDVPIALGICVLFGRSMVDILTASGPGYMDSFTGFVFFLLLGRLFQRNSFVGLSFERDYRSYFPLAVNVRDGEHERAVAVATLRPGQRLIARNGELIPADSRLRSPHGRIDFSYVTGESDPVEAERGDIVWAGGRVVGVAIELDVVREVSQSYLTRLWNQQSFHTPKGEDLSSLANRISRWFTAGVLLIAAATAAYWLHVDPSLAAMPSRPFSS
ncbi:MAG: heavy metal translocating P-type ATPase metal-binding domain-containing protein [bacterium]|nr:heavy metal translocating P-type ATPase metal-binding domain-containing protein [bacterium]